MLWLEREAHVIVVVLNAGARASARRALSKARVDEARCVHLEAPLVRVHLQPPAARLLRDESDGLASGRSSRVEHVAGHRPAQPAVLVHAIPEARRFPVRNN